MFADCPSKGVNNAFLSQVDLVGRPNNAFNTLTFTGARRDPHRGRQLVRGLQPARHGSTCRSTRRGTTCSTTSRTSRSRRPRALPEHEFEVPLIVQARSFRTDGERVLSAGGGSAARHARREPRRQPVLDADHRRQDQRGQRQGLAEHEREAAPLPLPDPQLGQPALLQASACRTACRCGSSAPTAATRTRPRRSPQFNRSASRSASTSWSTSRTSRSGRRSSCRTPRSGARRSAPRPDPNTDGTVMRFTVVDSPSVPPQGGPGQPGHHVPTLTPDRPRAHPDPERRIGRCRAACCRRSSTASCSTS